MIDIKNQSILYWNCASGIFNKADLIKNKVTEHSPDIFFVSESNLNSNMMTEILQINGYEFTSTKTMTETRKSRLCCYYNNNWSISSFEVGTLDELLILENKNTSVLGIYRPFKVYENETASSNFVRLLTKIQEYIDRNKNKNIILTGDFNVDYLKIGDKTYQRHNLSEILVEFQIYNNLEQMVTEITRHRLITKNGNQILQTSLLDHVYTNGLHVDLVEILPTVASDHDILKIITS